MEHALASRRFLAAVGAVILATGLFAAWIGLRIGGARVTLWVDDVATPLAALIACVLCLRARASAQWADAAVLDAARLRHRVLDFR